MAYKFRTSSDLRFAQWQSRAARLVAPSTHRTVWAVNGYRFVNRCAAVSAWREMGRPTVPVRLVEVGAYGSLGPVLYGAPAKLEPEPIELERPHHYECSCLACLERDCPW